ncbi:hypothetical protein OfM1_21690 [Lactovum odontotermitis]
MKNFTKKFWEDLMERAIRTFCQSLIAVGLAGASDLISVDWINALSVAALATIISALTSIASSNVGDSGTASLIKKEEE